MIRVEIVFVANDRGRGRAEGPAEATEVHTRIL